MYKVFVYFLQDKSNLEPLTLTTNELIAFKKQRSIKLNGAGSIEASGAATLQENTWALGVAGLQGRQWRGDNLAPTGLIEPSENLGSSGVAGGSGPIRPNGGVSINTSQKGLTGATGKDDCVLIIRNK